MNSFLAIFRVGFILFSLLTLNGCNQISMPELSMPQIGLGEEPKPALPVSVIYAFDPSVTEATLEVDACGLPYTIKSGELIPQAFLQVGNEQFQSVAAYAGTGQAVQASQSADLTIHLKLMNQSFQPANTIDEGDTFIAFVNLQMLAVYIDAKGRELAQTPLSYSEQVSMWTPALTGQSISCTTGRYDDVVLSASDQMARQMASVIPELLNQKSPQQQTAQATLPPSTQASPPVLPILKFRTMLKDGNNNLVLEGGEIIALQVETTNTGNTPLNSVTIDLTGSPTILKAFTNITPLPISVGNFQPGETKTTEIRGKMPFNVPERNGELVVSLNPGDGSTIASHRILAALQPGRGQSTTNATVAGSAPSPRQRKLHQQKSPYLAILVGMNQYRDKWPKAYRTRKGQLAALAETLQTTGVFSDRNIRVLQGARAARTDIEEALLTWGRGRMNKDAVLVFYFSGQALNHPTTGEVYLVPFEGSPKASPKRLISLRTLQRVLAKLDNRLTLLILDTPVTPLLRETGGIGTNGSVPIKWSSGIPRSAQNGTRVIQIRKIRGHGKGDPADILAGLLGRADSNGNGTITVGELIQDLSGMAEITPTLKPSSPETTIPLAQ